MTTHAIILAAGEGTRMKSAKPKVLHEMLGKPLVSWVVDAVRAACVDHIVLVVGHASDRVRALFEGADDLEFVEQTRRLGTGHAVATALNAAGIQDGQVLVLCADTPLVRPETLCALMSAAQKPSAAQRGTQQAGALLTCEYSDPSGYGRVIVDDEGCATQVIEQKDCTEQQARIRLCNAGLYCFDATVLRAHISELTRDNAQHEYYLTDMVGILRTHGFVLATRQCADPDELQGINSRVQLAQASRAMQMRINEECMLQGVTMLDPTQVWIGPDVQIGRDTEILPATMLWGKTIIGSDCIIGPQTRLTDTVVGDGCVVDETVAIRAVLDNRVMCGPRAYLRPGAHLCDDSKAGTHVEIKNSVVGPHSKVPHLSYIGDCTIGSEVNIGAGTITCNYDGKKKHPTTIGDGSFIGSDTMLVAPVTVGSGCTTGAGSTITHDVPDGALALERTQQKTINNWCPKS